MVDLLLEGGAGIDAATQFWANGFWLEKIPVVVSRHLIKKGAKPTIHAATALGLADIVSDLLFKDNSLVNKYSGWRWGYGSSFCPYDRGRQCLAGLQC